MADAVEDRETMPDEGDVLVPGDVLAVGVADQQIDRFVLDPLVHEEHVGAGALAKLGFGHAAGQRGLDPLIELLARRAGDDVDGPHVEVGEELGQRNELVGVAPQRHALAVEVLVHVGDHVHQPAALVVDRRRHLRPDLPAERVDEAVGCPQADGQFQQLEWHFELGVELLCGRLGGRRPQGHRGLAGRRARKLLRA